ncbi:MAG: ACT domain-containing protein [Planctomycetota bacterium]
MRIEKQFSVFMVNKPGALAQVLREFARAKLNIQAMTMVDSVEHGVMRLVVDSREKVKSVLGNLNMPYNETDVLCVTLSNKPGALADVVEELSKNHINISYAYCTAGAKGGKATGVLKVADVKKAMKVLQDKPALKVKTQPNLRRTPTAQKR